MSRLKTPALVSFSLLALAVSATPCLIAHAEQHPLTSVVVLVRHADKANEPADDPPLTPAGKRRAQDLASALRNAGLTAIITTQFLRSRQTALPLATENQIRPEIIH